MNLKYSEIMKIPEADAALADQLLQEELKKNTHKIVVLDDDPTGVQTVHDISVFTGWDAESIREGFAEEKPLFYADQFTGPDAGRDHARPS